MTETSSSHTSATFDTTADKVAGFVRDAVYVMIGAGVLTVQQLQVRRRELSGSFPGLEATLGQLDERLTAVEAKLDAAVEAVEQRLPEQAGVLLGQAHDVAKAARQQLRGLVRNAA